MHYRWQSWLIQIYVLLLSACALRTPHEMWQQHGRSPMDYQEFSYGCLIRTYQFTPLST
jgi:hypothetical protein